MRQISRSHGSKNCRIRPKLGVSGQQFQFEFTDGYEMLHKAWNSKGEVSYCFPKSSINFQGHTGQNITDFDPNWAFPDYGPVAAFKSLRFALFQGHPSNFKVTRYKTSPILTQIGRFRTIGQSQLSNPSDLPCFLGSSIKYQGHRGEKSTILIQFE